MEQSENVDELFKALSKMQGSLNAVKKDSTNPFFNSKYATLSAIWDVCRKPLEDNGLCISQSTDVIEGNLFLVTRLGHSSGQWIQGKLPIRLEKNTPQGMGSAITYAKRYALSAMIGVSLDEDDDGNMAERELKSNNKRELNNREFL